MILVLGTSFLQAQEGHPLHGSWSGNRVVEGQQSRLLVVMQLERDQSFSGYIIEDRKRIPLKSVVLDPDDWTVTIALEDNSYQLEGRIEDMGSATGRHIQGRWSSGNRSGDFQLQIN